MTTEKAGQAACSAEEQDAHNESGSDDATSVAGRMHSTEAFASGPPPGDTFAVALRALRFPPSPFAA